MTVSTVDSGIVVCRNLMDGPTVIASDQKSTHEVIFQGKGDPDGGDYQHMPAEIIKTPQFARAVSNGILEIDEGADSELVQNALRSQANAFRRRNQSQKTEAEASLERPQEGEILAVDCIGPGTRPGAHCGVQVPLKTGDARPPLCSAHENLAERCVKRGSEPWKLEA